MGALTSANAPGVYMRTEKPIQPLTPNHNNFSWIFGEAPISHVMIIFQLNVYHHFHLDGLNFQEKSELCPIFQSFRSPMVLVFPLGTSPFSKMDSMTWCAKLWTHSSPTSTKSSSTRAEVTSSGTQLLRQASKGRTSRSVFKRGGPQVFKKHRTHLSKHSFFRSYLDILKAGKWCVLDCQFCWWRDLNFIDSNLQVQTGLLWSLPFFFVVFFLCKELCS